jgi:hypothetical protein
MRSTGTTRLRRIAVGVVAVGLLLAAAGCGDDDDNATAVSTTEAAEPTASVALEAPEDGAEVTSPVHVEMAAEGFTVEPAAQGVREGAGHFHVLVDVGCVEPGEPIPVDTPGYNHFGMAQQEADLELEPGEHTLCLQAGNGAHIATDLTDEVTITVTG